MAARHWQHMLHSRFCPRLGRKILGSHQWGGQIKGEILDFRGGPRRPRATGKPFKKVGGEAPHLFEEFPGRSEPPRPRKLGFPFLIWPPSVSGTPMFQVLGNTGTTLFTIAD